MIFTTPWFILFAVLAVTVFRLLRIASWRLWWLAAACAVFHTYFAGPAGVLPIIGLMVVTFFAGRSRSPAWCVAAMALCVAALGFYKYAVFFIGAAVEPWSPALAANMTTGAKAVMPGAPPLAVSFFVFEFVHYLFEVRRRGEPIRSPLKFVLFAIFSPPWWRVRSSGTPSSCPRWRRRRRAARTPRIFPKVCAGLVSAF
jgi:alginate O-acetyltransferase complex protein AlgI